MERCYRITIHHHPPQGKLVWRDWDAPPRVGETVEVPRETEEGLPDEPMLVDANEQVNPFVASYQ